MLDLLRVPPLMSTDVQCTQMRTKRVDFESSDNRLFTGQSAIYKNRHVACPPIFCMPAIEFVKLDRWENMVPYETAAYIVVIKRWNPTCGGVAESGKSTKSSSLLVLRWQTRFFKYGLQDVACMKLKLTTSSVCKMEEIKCVSSWVWV